MSAPVESGIPSASPQPGQAAQAPQAAEAVVEPALLAATLAARCPRCGEGPLFDGWLRFAARCRSCALDLGQFNVGDGPAAFLILIVGAIVVALALFVQLSFAPPFWVHILLWVPFTTAAVIGCLRLSKAALLILEYRTAAREGRLAGDGGTAAAPAGEDA
jgi:uncharacterized protein (DUF983 family)